MNDPHESKGAFTMGYDSNSYIQNGQTIASGGQSVTGGATIDTLSGGVPAVQTVATGGTIAVTGARVIRATVASGATASNLSLGSGLSGQEITVVNENATGGSTLGITGSVSAATSISGLSAKKFVWDPSQTAWVNPS
jgi:hypothetical protein